MTAPPESAAAATTSAVNHYEDFLPGRWFDHRWGRTIGESEAIDFATTCLIHEPGLFNRDYARQLGYRDLLVSPHLVYATVLGMSVADLSESGGPFLGSDKVAFDVPVHPGDTLYASSAVVTRRPSRSKSGFGVVEWRTIAVNQYGERVLSFQRRNLVRFRDHDAWTQEVGSR